MKCIICETHDQWENVDAYRRIPKQMHLCRSCGFVSYPKRYEKKDELVSYYKTEYRKPPTVNNFYTGKRKLHYHSFFLKDLIDDWQKAGKTDPVVCDVGAAFGMFLNFWKVIRRPDSDAPVFPQAKLYGSELTTSFKRVAYHEYGIKLSDEIDETIDYDLITSYKSGEHIFDFDAELKKYRQCLEKKQGYLYISVPTWFRIAHNFGVGNSFDIEYYYHPDHVNTWTEAQFRYLLGRCGFEIIKEDHYIYDSTYLCKLATEKKDPQLIDGSLAFARAALQAIFKADRLALDGDFAAAVKTWPNFPAAWRGFYEHNRATLHKEGFAVIKETIIDRFQEIDAHNAEFDLISADLHMRYQRWDEAIVILKAAAARKPNCSRILTMLADCFRAQALAAAKTLDKDTFIAKTDTARQISRRIAEIDPSLEAQALTWIYNDHAQIPIP